MMHRRAVPTERRPSAWFVVAAGLVLYSAAVVVLALARISPTLLLPWWLAQAIPPIAYAVLIRVCVRGVSVSRWMTATALLWIIHVFLGVVTAAVVASMGAWSVDFSVVEAFPPPLIPEVLWVPLLLLPLRDPIAGHPHASERRRVPDREVDEGPSAVLDATIPVRPARPMTAERMAPTPISLAPVAAPVTEHPRSDVRWPQRAPRDTDPQAHPRGDDERPGTQPAGPVPSPVTAAAPARRPVEAPPPKLDETAGQEMLSAPMRVSFDRIASQFPPGAFHVPLDEISVKLPEPGYLSIPARLVLAQLDEGVVRAGWDVVAPQIPERFLAIRSEEMPSRLADGLLILPLDELVPQVPADLLLSLGPAEVDGIEHFPAPFQPTGSSEAPVIPESEPEPEWRESPAEWPLAETTTEEAVDLPTLDDVELDPGLTGLIVPQPESPLQSTVTPDAAMTDDSPPPASPPPGEIVEAPVPRESVVPFVVPPAPTQSRAETPSEPPAAGLSARSGMLDVLVASVEGVKILAASSSGIGVGAAVAATKLLLPVMAASHGQWTMDQVTLRGQDGALVLTPLGLARGTGSVLVSAVPPGGSLALAEISSLRAAATHALGMTGPAADEAPSATQDVDLLETDATMQVQQTAATLDAMGSVIATVLRVASTGRTLYLFLPPGSDVRQAARLAREIDEAMGAGARLGPVFDTATLRCGPRRLIIRMDARDKEGSSIFILGGETGRPGLAYRQADDAALALGAR